MKLNSKITRKLTIIMLVIILWAIFAITTDNFVTPRNTFMLLKDSAFVGIIAVGMCFVMVSGGVDISAGGMIAALAIICARISFSGMPGFLIVILTAICGMGFGLVNSILIVKLKLSDFVATLATGIAYGGLAYVFAFHNETTGVIASKGITNKSFLALGRPIGQIYPITIVWIVLSIIALIIITKTKFGTHVYASGSNANSAKMSGVNADLVKMVCYVISGAMAGVAASLVVANQTAAASSVGTGYEFQAMAACVVGGIVLGGGKGDHISAIFGSIFMTLIINGLNKYGLNVAFTYLAEGAIIILATAYDSILNTALLKRQIAKNIKEAREAQLESQGGAGE